MTAQFKEHADATRWALEHGSAEVIDGTGRVLVHISIPPAELACDDPKCVATRSIFARQRAALIALAERVRRVGGWATTEDQWALWNAEAVAREEV